MSKYVNADELMQSYVGLEFSSDMGDAMEILDNAPSIDICFCRECKHWNYGLCPVLRRNNMRADDFCSYGEKGASHDIR